MKISPEQIHAERMEARLKSAALMQSIFRYMEKLRREIDRLDELESAYRGDRLFGAF